MTRLNQPVQTAVALAIMLFFAVQPGCQRSTPTAQPLPKGMTFEVYRVTTDETGATKSLPNADGGTTVVQAAPLIASTDIQTISVVDVPAGTPQPGGSGPSLDIVLTTGGGAKFAKATAQSGTVAVVINGQIVCTPKLVAPLGPRFRVTADTNNPTLAQVMGQLLH